MVEVSDFSRACELDMETTFDKFDPCSTARIVTRCGTVVTDFDWEAKTRCNF